jgi:hypothetical protein
MLLHLETASRRPYLLIPKEKSLENGPSAQTSTYLPHNNLEGKF